MVAEQVKACRLGASTDFHLAFSPEREDPANSASEVGEVPKLIGGLTAACLEKAMQVYGQAVKTLFPFPPVASQNLPSSWKTSFTANITLVNELKLVYGVGIDILGGHCRALQCWQRQASLLSLTSTASRACSCLFANLLRITLGR
jgi:UDP-N-acetyl-D-glucosamine dehydrogenase